MTTTIPDPPSPLPPEGGGRPPVAFAPRDEHLCKAVLRGGDVREARAMGAVRGPERRGYPIMRRLEAHMGGRLARRGMAPGRQPMKILE